MNHIKPLEGILSAKGLRIAILAARFNHSVVEKLIEGAKDCFVRHQADPADLSLIYVPGAYELPLAAKSVASTGGVDAVLCLGAVIRGETAHFEYVASEAAKGIAQVSLETGVPVSFGVLTTYTAEQAESRAGGKAGNKGFEAALSLIEMANLLPQIDRKFSL